MNTSLENICLALLAVFLFSSCALLDSPSIPKVEGKPFPNIGSDSRGAGVAGLCQKGNYVGKHISDTGLIRAYSWLKKEPNRPDPAGKGKILTRYMIDQIKIPPPMGHEKYGHPGWEDEWGYTFTVHTTDDGIITRCSATEQFLRRR